MPKRVSSAPSDLVKAQISSSPAEDKTPVLDARERRRQKLRLSQNESSKLLLNYRIIYFKF